jgi:hypothetical protein
VLSKFNIQWRLYVRYPIDFLQFISLSSERHLHQKTMPHYAVFRLIHHSGLVVNLALLITSCSKESSTVISTPILSVCYFPVRLLKEASYHIQFSLEKATLLSLSHHGFTALLSTAPTHCLNFSIASSFSCFRFLRSSSLVSTTSTSNPKSSSSRPFLSSCTKTSTSTSVLRDLTATSGHFPARGCTHRYRYIAPGLVLLLAPGRRSKTPT